MKKAVLFLTLYFYALGKYLLRQTTHTKPKGEEGKVIFLFCDRKTSQKLHGVVAFVLPQGTDLSQYKQDLYGPFGYTNEIDLKGFHLYGRDTWGTVNNGQIIANRPLLDLLIQYPGHTILLAGVRKLWGHHIFPLNNPESFILVKK